jgi:hypothetical protein
MAPSAPRWVPPVFAGAGLVLVPWVVLLVDLLPSTHRSAHWDIAWGGFDVALALLLIAVAVAAWRRSAWLEGAATAAATLLLVDGWFDVLTSSSNAELALALVMALLVEVPMAVLCLCLARNAERRLARLAYASGAKRGFDESRTQDGASLALASSVAPRSAWARTLPSRAMVKPPARRSA